MHASEIFIIIMSAKYASQSKILNALEFEM